MADQSEKEATCAWQGTAARGVYKPDCTDASILGVPPKPGDPCPYCGRKCVPTKPHMPALWRNFYNAFKELRRAFVTDTNGGSITMKLDVRDAEAEARYQKRKARKKS